MIPLQEKEKEKKRKKESLLFNRESSVWFKRSKKIVLYKRQKLEPLKYNYESGL